MRRILSGIIPVGAYACVILLIFWSPLVRQWGSIQWDSVGVHFLNISFSSELLRGGFMPLWSPYLFGGFPQIADMQVALWYPPVLLFAVLAKFSTTSLMWEIALHYILAASFMYVLAREFKTPRIASWGLGLAYALGGFMVGHASHVGMMNAAAWLPLILLLLMRALDRRSLRYAIGCGVALGTSMLAGHFQISLYTILLVVLYGAWEAMRAMLHRQWRVGATLIGLVAVAGLFSGGIAAVQYIPTFQLVAQSERSNIPLAVAQSESLKPSALNGFVHWNYRGVATGPYTGPWDRTQNYLFIGLSTLALAIMAIVVGLFKTEHRSRVAFFALTSLFAIGYAVGPATPLHGFLYHVPLLGTVRAPGNMLLLAHLSLLCLAALSWRLVPPKLIRWGAVVFAVIICIELVPKALQNNLLWARQAPSQIFANTPIAEQVLQEYKTLSPERRFRVWRVPGLDTNEPQYWRIDDFGGYNPLELARHARYVDTMVAHPTLIALAGIRYGPCNLIQGVLMPAPWAPGTCRTASYQSRAFLVGRTQAADSPQQSLELLTRIDPSSIAVIERDASSQEPELVNRSLTSDDTIVITSERPGFIRLNVTASDDAFAVITQTFWPGWEVTIDDEPAPLWRTDYLFQGVRVPAGEHVVELSFTSQAYAIGASATLLTLASALGLWFLLSRNSRQIKK